MQTGVAEAEEFKTSRDLSVYRPKMIPIEVLIDYADKGLTQPDIAKILGCHASNVSKRLTEYGYTKERVDNWSAHRARVLQLMQANVANNLTPAKMQKASLRDSAVVLGILIDKELDLTVGRPDNGVQVTINQASAVLSDLSSLHATLSARLVNVPEPCEALQTGDIADTVCVDNSSSYSSNDVEHGDSLHNYFLSVPVDSTASSPILTPSSTEVQSDPCLPLPRVKRSYVLRSKGKDRGRGGADKSRAVDKDTAHSTDNISKKSFPGPSKGFSTYGWLCSCSHRNVCFFKVCKSCGKEKPHV